MPSIYIRKFQAQVATQEGEQERSQEAETTDPGLPQKVPALVQELSQAPIAESVPRRHLARKHPLWLVPRIYQLIITAVWHWNCRRSSSHGRPKGKAEQPSPN